MTWSAPEDLDPECTALCAALNTIQGLDTVESCCGHGQWGFYVLFDATPEAIEDLRSRIEPFAQWQLTVRSHWHCLLGPTGEEGYCSADQLARHIAVDATLRSPSERSESWAPTWARAVAAEAARNAEAGQ